MEGLCCTEKLTQEEVTKLSPFVKMAENLHVYP